MNRPSFLRQNRFLVAGIAVAIVFLAGIGYALAGSGLSSSSPDGATASVAVAPDVAPTTASTVAPTTTTAAAASTATPAARPTVAPTAAPEANRADCDKIRGTDYLSETEHQWFIANCTGPRAATPVPGGSTPAPGATVPAGGGTTDPIAAIATALSNIRTYRSTVVISAPGSPTQNWLLEGVLPNRIHVDGGTFEVILIGADIYLKIGGAWSKQPPAAIPSLSSIPDLNSLLKQANLTARGTDSVNGKACQLFGSGASTLCVDSNYMPVRWTYADASVQTSIFFTAINGPVAINPPV